MPLSHIIADYNGQRSDLVGKLQQDQALLHRAWERRRGLLAEFDAERFELTIQLAQAARIHSPEAKGLAKALDDLSRREQQMEEKAAGFLAEIDGRFMQTLAALRDC